jgi:DNA-binding PadR family transcriptional regulator
MQINDIYQFFQNPPPLFLNQELAACYVIFFLLKGDSYGTELIQLLERDYPTYRLSDTVLYSALKFLEDEGMITGYWKKVEGRGRPRRMYRILPEVQDHAEELATLWQRYMAQVAGSLPSEPA